MYSSLYPMGAANFIYGHYGYM